MFVTIPLNAEDASIQLRPLASSELWLKSLFKVEFRHADFIFITISTYDARIKPQSLIKNKAAVFQHTASLYRKCFLYQWQV